MHFNRPLVERPSWAKVGAMILAPLAIALSAALLTVAPEPGSPSAPTAEAAPAAEASGSGLPGGLDPGAWVGDEDLLLVFQTVTALGAASLVGGVALLPAYAGFFFVVLISLASQSPGLLVAGPAAMLALTVVAQALVAGFTTWVVSLASEGFAARTYVPTVLRDVIKERTGVDAGRGWAAVMLGAPWLTGFAGYLVGAMLGLAAGVALAAPLIGAGLVLSQAPEDNPPGILALLLSLMAGLTVMAVAETLIAPPLAAIAHHLTKVAIADSASP